MKIIKHAADILLGPGEAGFRKLAQFSIQKANSFQLSKEVKYILSISTKNIERLAENSPENGFSSFMFSSPGNRRTASD